jgi:hypothetical protein
MPRSDPVAGIARSMGMASTLEQNIEELGAPTTQVEDVNVEPPEGAEHEVD